MNITKKLPYLVAILGCLLGYYGAMAAPAVSIDASSEQYKTCTARVKDKPTDALALANDWLLKENTPGALHCRALAKYGLKQFDAAGRDLESLAHGVGKAQPKLWVNLARQAATAYSLAGQKDKAVAVLSEAVVLADGRQVTDTLPGLLLDKANIGLEQKKPLLAIQDMDQLLSINPDDPDALLVRARAYIALSLKDDALRDLKSGLLISPDNKEMIALKKKLEPAVKSTAKKKSTKKKAVKKTSAKKKSTKKSSKQKKKKSS